MSARYASRTSGAGRHARHSSHNRRTRQARSSSRAATKAREARAAGTPCRTGLSRSATTGSSCAARTSPPPRGARHLPTSRRRPSATRIVPELQHIAVGTLFPALPGLTEGFVVLAFEPQRLSFQALCANAALNSFPSSAPAHAAAAPQLRRGHERRGGRARRRQTGLVRSASRAHDRRRPRHAQGRLRLDPPLPLRQAQERGILPGQPVDKRCHFA